ncbi:hypothetical protein EYF80_068095 [Liparis tanakae]|uniref:Uncharacterized protein n=1 Tax=Liparis tanakae TaxID=230148 RepID=A0A4Z2DZ22_9TELE|nr:hypothetical protein EYF80_068095 [Liparis tanakae]
MRTRYTLQACCSAHVRVVGAERWTDVQRPRAAVLSDHLEAQAGGAAARVLVPVPVWVLVPLVLVLVPLVLVPPLHRQAQRAAFGQQLLLVGRGQLVDDPPLHLRGQRSQRNGQPEITSLSVCVFVSVSVCV